MAYEAVGLIEGRLVAAGKARESAAKRHAPSSAAVGGVAQSQPDGEGNEQVSVV